MEDDVTTDTLDQQVAFLVEIDKLKTIERKSVLIDGSRYENSAEHSWHVAMCAVILAEYASGDVDIAHVVRMLLAHDIVEVDAGDTYAYDSDGRRDQRAREEVAGRRLFGLLPNRQSREMFDLWAEFDAQETLEAKYANAIDRFMPLLHNFYTKGKSWKEHGVSRQQVMERAAGIRDGAPLLWSFAVDLIDEAVRRRYLRP